MLGGDARLQLVPAGLRPPSKDAQNPQIWPFAQTISLPGLLRQSIIRLALITNAAVDSAIIANHDELRSNMPSDA